MPKKRKKTCEAWKALRKQHLKGPKRIRLDNPRRKDGIDPITVAKHIKMVEIHIFHNYIDCIFSHVLNKLHNFLYHVCIIAYDVHGVFV